jgi:hypothetical protein
VGEILAAPSSGRVSVRVDGATLSLPIVRSYTPTVGDECLVLMRRHGGFVIGAPGTAPPAANVVPSSTAQAPPPADDPTPSRPKYGSDVFRPTSTGSYRNGSWRGDTNDLYGGDWSGRGSNKGGAYYGKGPRGLRGATVTRVRVKLRRQDGGVYGGVTPTLRLLAESSRSGAPNDVLSTAGPSLSIGEAVTFTLPDAWGQRMVDGTAGGIGVWSASSSPYVHLDGPSLSLLIDWKRSS